MPASAWGWEDPPRRRWSRGMILYRFLYEGNSTHATHTIKINHPLLASVEAVAQGCRRDKMAGWQQKRGKNLC